MFFVLQNSDRGIIISAPYLFVSNCNGVKVLSFKLSGASDIWESSPPEITKQSIVSLSGMLENPFVLLLARRVIVSKTFGPMKLVCRRLFTHLKQTYFPKSHCFGYQKYYEMLFLTALRGEERAALLMFGVFFPDSLSSYYSVSLRLLYPQL